MSTVNGNATIGTDNGAYVTAPYTHDLDALIKAIKVEWELGDRVPLVLEAAIGQDDVVRIPLGFSSNLDVTIAVA